MNGDGRTHLIPMNPMSGSIYLDRKRLETLESMFPIAADPRMDKPRACPTELPMDTVDTKQ